MVFKFARKSGAFGWKYLDGKMFETIHIAKKDVLDYARKHNKNDDYYNILIDYIREETDHGILGGSIVAFYIGSKTIDAIEHITLIIRTNKDDSMDSIGFDTHEYNGYLMTDEGRTIEKIIG